MKKIFYVVISLLCITGLIASYVYFNNQKTEIIELQVNTGTLSGKVTLISGDCMPKDCDELPCESNCLTEGISRIVYIKEITNSDNNLPDFNDIKKSILIKTIMSNSDGSYTVILPIGKYSIFVEDNGNEYCNSFDEQGYCVVEIKKDQITEYNPEINYAVE
ncbi:MAG: hypothetical protein WC254_03220 [Candidatus Woesearchaeota archaeon]|jgi:hypothetical protein